MRRRSKKVYFDSGAGLIHVSVEKMEPYEYGNGLVLHIVSLRLKETMGAYRKGELIETSPRYTVYKLPPSNKYPYHQMVRHLSREEICALLPASTNEKTEKKEQA